MALTSRTITVHGLGDNEHRVLDDVTSTARTTSTGRWQAQAHAAFVDSHGFVQQGEVRCARRHPSQETRYEIATVAGVASVTRESILSVTWGYPVPGYGEAQVSLQSDDQGIVTVDPNRAGSLGLAPWDQCYGAGYTPAPARV